MLVRNRRGMGFKAAEDTTPVGPPNSVVIIDVDGAKVAAQLDDTGQVASMQQLPERAASGGSITGFLTANKTLLIYLGLGIFALSLMGGRRR